MPQAPLPPSLRPAFSVLPRRDLLAALLHLRILRLFLCVSLALLVPVVLLVLAVSLLPFLQSYILLLRPVPAPPLSSLCSSWGSQNGPRVQGLLLHSSLEANGWYLDFRTVGTFVHTPDERETSRHPMNKKSASVNEPRRWQSGFWARQASCAVSELSNNYVTRPREFEACPGSDVHRQLFGRPSKSFPADIWSAGGTDLKSALAGAGFSLHAAERLMRMEQPQVPNCPSLRPGPVGTGFWSVRTRSPANSSAREGKAGKLCED